MEEKNLTVDERLFLEAKKYCRTRKPEERGDFYYTLLDWCDQHKEITNSLAQKNDVYDVVYIDNMGNAHRETFTATGGQNPYQNARKKYGELLGQSVQVAELRRRPNPYLSGQDRMGAVILSYERKER